jgi:hypothetical protein
MLSEFNHFCSTCGSRTTVSTEFSLPVAADNCDEDGDPKCSSDLRLSLTFSVSYSEGLITRLVVTLKINISDKIEVVRKGIRTQREGIITRFDSQLCTRKYFNHISSHYSAKLQNGRDSVFPSCRYLLGKLAFPSRRRSSL